MSTGLLLTTSDLELMPDDGNRYELLEGELVVSRAPSLSHQDISGNIYTIIRDYLKGNPIGKVYLTPGVIFDQFSSVIPDLVWVSHEREAAIVQGERFVAAPELMIEIISPGEPNARRDRTTKRQIYGRFGVTEYWIVDPERSVVERYGLVANVLELQATAQVGEELRSDVLPGFVCPIIDIFRR